MKYMDSNFLLGLLSRAYPGIICYVNQEYKFEFASEQYSHWFGCHPNAMIGLHVSEVFGTYYFDERKPYIDLALQGNSVKFHMTIHHKTLGKRHTEQIYQPDIGPDGLVRGFLSIVYDVTEQRLAEKRLQRFANDERKRLYSLFMQTPIGISVLTGPNHVFELFNNKAIELIGGKDVTGLPIAEALPGLVSQGFSQHLDEIYETGLSKFLPETPMSFKQADGRTRHGYLDLYLEPWKDEEGNIIGILNMVLDVTEKVRVRKEAQEKEELFRTYAESMPQMAFIANAKGNITYLNQRWFDYTGLNLKSSEKWANHPIHEDDFEKAFTTWKECISTGTPYQIEARLRRHDGTYRWHLSRAVPLRNSQGKITQWVGTNTDIHDQKLVAVHQARLLQVLESSSDFIGMADTNGKCVYLNGAAKKMLSLDQDDEIDRITVYDKFFEEDLPFVKEVIIPSTIKNGSWVGDFRLKNFKTGEEKWVHYYSFTTHDDQTRELTGFATVSRDLTDIKAKERKLEDALRARDEFLSIASHELKTPLTSLKLQSQLTLRTLDRGVESSLLPAKQKMMARQTNDLVSRLSRLIDDMLDVSRIRTGKLNLEKNVHDLTDIVGSVVTRMALLFEISGLEVPIIRSSQEVLGHWDRFRLEQVIGNLLTNAIRYGRGQPIEIDIKLMGERVHLSVRDFGYGIGANDQKRIFERFERAINPAEVSGMGLGLYISQEIIQSHEGKIWVESEIDKGSLFTVELPTLRSECIGISS